MADDPTGEFTGNHEGSNRNVRVALVIDSGWRGAYSDPDIVKNSSRGEANPKCKRNRVGFLSADEEHRVGFTVSLATFDVQNNRKRGRGLFVYDLLVKFRSNVWTV